MTASGLLSRTVARNRLARVSIHAVTALVLDVIWRATWVPGDPAANRPGRWAARARRWWIETLPVRGEASPAPSADVAVSVMIPVGPADVAIAPLAVAGVQRNLLDPIRSITLLTPPEHVAELTAALADFEGVEVIDETTVVEESELRVVREATRPHRSGWYVQQIVKLAWCLERSGPITYVIDADTVLVRPQRFHTERGDAFFQSDDYHPPYFDHLARLFGSGFRRPLIATTVHQMLYRADWLSAMVRAIEREHPGRTWIEAIADAIDIDELSGFSEGECYGQWALRHRRRDVVIHRFENADVSRAQTGVGDLGAAEVAERANAVVAELSDAYGDRLDSVSLHYYIDDDPIPAWREAGLL